MKKTEYKKLLEYMQTHFEEMETLLKMELVQNLTKELGAGVAELQPPRAEKIMLQMDGREWDVNDCRSRVIADYVSSAHEACAIKSLAVYLKPKERKVYYVVNEEYYGSVDLPEQDQMPSRRPSKPVEGIPTEYPVLRSTLKAVLRTVPNETFTGDVVNASKVTDEISKPKTIASSRTTR